MKKNRLFPMLIFVVIVGIGLALAYVVRRVSADFEALWILTSTVVVAFIVSSAIQVADQ